MPQIVAKFIELVEYHQIFTRTAQLPALVKNFFDIGFAARRFDNFTRNIGQPIKTLFAHPFRKNGDRFTSQQCRIIRSTPAIISRGRPYCFLGCRIELACHEARHQAAKGGTNFMRPCWEPFAHQGDDPGWRTGQTGGKLEIVHTVITTAESDRFVLPCYPEEV